MYFDMDLHSRVSAQDVLLHQFGYSYLNLSFPSLQVLGLSNSQPRLSLLSTESTPYVTYIPFHSYHSGRKIPVFRSSFTFSFSLRLLAPPPLQASSPPTSSIPILHVVPAVKSHIRNSPPSFNTLLKGLPAHSTRIRPSLSSRHTG
jgi:hypothetical protein